MLDQQQLEKFLFRLNLLVTTAVFVLLIPTTQILSDEYAEAKDRLWQYPLTVMAVSAALWFLSRLSIPLMIRMGWIEERRLADRPRARWMIRILRIMFPILIFTVHTGFVILCCVGLMEFMRSGIMPSFLGSMRNIP